MVAHWHCLPALFWMSTYVASHHLPVAMDKLQLTGQNLGKVFNFRSDHLHGPNFWCYLVKLPNLKLKTQLNQLSGSLLLVITLPTVASQSFTT
jgi:hypothetical protein